MVRVQLVATMDNEAKFLVTVSGQSRDSHGISDWLSMMGHTLTVRSVLRISLGIVFIFSGVAKLYDVYSFSNVVRSYGILTENLVTLVALAIPFAELILGMMLIISYHSHFASFALLVMVVVFTGLTAWKYFAGNTSGCGCFGKIVERKVNLNLFIENAAIMAALLSTKAKNLKNTSKGVKNEK